MCALAALVCAALLPATVSPSAGASSVLTLRERADGLAQQIQTDYAKLGVLDEAFDEAHARVVELAGDVTAASHAIARAGSNLKTDEAHLRTVAIDAYMNGGSTAGLTVLMSANSGSLPMQQAYLKAASGDLQTAESLVIDAAHRLSVRRRVLLADEKKAAANERQIASSRALAEQITANLENQLSAVKGQLAREVAAAEAAQEVQRRAAAAAAALAKQSVVETQPSTQAPPAPPAPPAPTVVGGGAGAVAVRAAESQLGVPYVWGGATPGVGFDCSGLTMWSWEQAGVSLAHGATEQYYEIAHVSMSQLRPGDLIFYGSASYLYHVVMYVGSGPYGADTVIQAEQTGTNVMFTPIPPGAYGAGQP